MIETTQLSPLREEIEADPIDVIREKAKELLKKLRDALGLPEPLPEPIPVPVDSELTMPRRFEPPASNDCSP